MPDGRAIVTGSPGARRRLARDALAFDFRLLINVAGPQRRVFVGRRMLDVAMHADRAAVHDAAGRRRRRPPRSDRRRPWR